MDHVDYVSYIHQFALLYRKMIRLSFVRVFHNIVLLLIIPEIQRLDRNCNETKQKTHFPLLFNPIVS